MTEAAYPLPSFDEPGDDPGERRSEKRRACHLMALVREFGRPGKPVRVTNLSEHGCRLQGCDFSVNSELWIKFASVPPIRARVVWAHDDSAGCRFDEPLASVMVALADLGEE